MCDYKQEWVHIEIQNKAIVGHQTCLHNCFCIGNSSTIVIFYVNKIPIEYTEFTLHSAFIFHDFSFWWCCKYNYDLTYLGEYSQVTDHSLSVVPLYYK